MNLLIFVIWELLCLSASDKSCEVTFRNIGGLVGGINASLSVLSAVLNSRREIFLSSDTDWNAFILAMSFDNLRLVHNLTISSGVEVRCLAGSKLIELGANSIWNQGPDVLRASLTKQNPSPYPVRLVFREDRHVGWLGQGDTQTVTTFVGHAFEIESPGTLPVLFRIERDGDVLAAVQDGQVATLPTGALIKGPAGATETWSDLYTRISSTCRKPFSQHPEDAEYFCGPRFNYRLHVSSRYDFHEANLQEQLKRNRLEKSRHSNRQVPGLRKFTAAGFSVQMGAQDIVQRVHKFYIDKRLHESTPELVDIWNPTLSTYESDTWSLTIPDAMKDELDAVLRPLVADWSGLHISDLQVPIIHGPRLYHNGSLLHSHVDNFGTHAFGVILHIAHLHFSEEAPPKPWPLVILDHAGVKHQLAPDTLGSIVLYESATCWHYREGSFEGREFANIFMHYAPVGWPQAYHQSVEL